MKDVGKILTNNGFKYHNCSKYSNSLVVEDLEIVNHESIIDYITVSKNSLGIFINFKDSVPQTPNFGLDFDISGYKYFFHGYVDIHFLDENDFIEELQRLNSTGLNIKG